MDLFHELENLAVNATYEDSDEDKISDDPSQGTIKMFQDRFGYTYEQAAELACITKTINNPSSTMQTMLSPAQARIVYAVKLDGPISTPQKVQIATNLPTVPQSYHGSGEEGNAAFCKVEGRSKVAIEQWISAQKIYNFKPLFVPEGRAYKDLCPTSLYPTLGKDTTLPQYRPQDTHLLGSPPSFGPPDTQFPVWYFFYGTLADVPKLRSLLSLGEDEIPILHEASVMGGNLATWGNGKYNALLNGPETSRIEGSAYQVASEEDEDALREYETNAYEVVKCSIVMNGCVVDGRTFRFVGEID